MNVLALPERTEKRNPVHFNEVFSQKSLLTPQWNFGGATEFGVDSGGVFTKGNGSSGYIWKNLPSAGPSDVGSVGLVCQFQLVSTADGCFVSVGESATNNSAFWVDIVSNAVRVFWRAGTSGTNFISRTTPVGWTFEIGKIYTFCGAYNSRARSDGFFFINGQEPDSYLDAGVSNASGTQVPAFTTIHALKRSASIALYNPHKVYYAGYVMNNILSKKLAYEISLNINRVYQKDSTRFYLIPSDVVALPTLSAPTAINITSSGFQPRVTATY